MASFVAICRDASTGRRHEVSITASSRAAAYTALAARGIHPIKIEEARADGRTGSPQEARRRVAIWVVIVVGGFIAAWWLWPTARHAPVRVPSSPVRTGGANVTSSRAPKVQGPIQASAKATGRTMPSASRHSGKQELPRPAIGGASAIPADAQEPPEAHQRAMPFRRGTDQLIAMAIFHPHDVPMPPMPGMGPGDTQAFLDSLATPIELPEDASETLKAMRDAVLEVRADIAKALRADPKASVQSILEGHRKLHNENIDIRAQAQKELDSILQMGDSDAVKKYLDEVNPVLREMGIEEVGLPEEESPAEEPTSDDSKP